MMFTKTSIISSILLIASWLPTASFAAPTFFFNDTPYLSDADIPVGFYLGGAPEFLEDFEDQSLDGSLIGTGGNIIGPGVGDGARDSVDGDDGNIDGSGILGSTWFNASGLTGVVFAFTGLELPTAFGIVWTDGGGQVTFSATDGNDNSLGSITESGFADAGFSGGTAEDRFFGIQSADGIKSIRIVNGSGGIEVDHVQYGTADIAAVPVPAAVYLFVSALGVCVSRRHR